MDLDWIVGFTQIAFKLTEILSPHFYKSIFDLPLFFVYRRTFSEVSSSLTSILRPVFKLQFKIYTLIIYTADLSPFSESVE